MFLVVTSWTKALKSRNISAYNILFFADSKFSSECIFHAEANAASGAKPKVIVVPGGQQGAAGNHDHQQGAAGNHDHQRVTVAGQVLPQGMKQTKMTDHADTNRLPAHVLQQMYAG